MSRESTLAAGRVAAETGLVDTVTWERRTGLSSVNESTGRQTPAYAPLFTSPCKIRIGALGSLIPTAKERLDAGREITTLRSVMHLPVTAPALLPEDMGTMTAVGANSDAQLLGRRFRVVAPIGQSYATARRFSVEEVIS